MLCGVLGWSMGQMVRLDVYPVYRSILPSAFDDGLKIRMVNPMEIFAAKGNALITRAAAESSDGFR